MRCQTMTGTRQYNKTTMNKYKVTITKEYTVDVQAQSSEGAEATAEQVLGTKMLEGTEHYLETSDTVYQVFDVTNTDDPFSP